MFKIGYGLSIVAREQQKRGGINVAENNNHNKTFAVANKDDVSEHLNNNGFVHDSHQWLECLLLVDKSNHDKEYP